MILANYFGFRWIKGDRVPVSTGSRLSDTQLWSLGWQTRRASTTGSRPGTSKGRRDATPADHQVDGARHAERIECSDRCSGEGGSPIARAGKEYLGRKVVEGVSF
jgi:hypothetical protein